MYTSAMGLNPESPLAVNTQKRRVLLLTLDWHRPRDPRLPLGHASLYASLKEARRVEVVNICHALNSPQFDLREVADDILAASVGKDASDLDLAIGAYVWNEAALGKLLPQLRNRGFRGRIILGGPQISYAGAGLEHIYPHADVFVRGYGEKALVELTANASRAAIQGVQYAGEAAPAVPAEVNLGELVSPYLSGSLELSPNQRFIRWETQRGCPFRCSFCQHREAGARLPHRALVLDRLFKEIELFVSYGVQDIATLDPIFNLGEHSLRILAELRRQQFRGRISFQCRFESMDDEFLDACRGLDVRLEFGLQTIHKVEGQAIQRFNKLDKVAATLSNLRARQIPFEVSLIYGLPLQTLRSFRESVDFCLAQKVPVIKAFPLMLLRGTRLEQERDRWGLRENDDPIPAVVKSSTFDEGDWAEMAKIAAALINTEGHHPTSIEGL